MRATLLTDIGGSDVEPSPRGHNFKKRVAEVATVESNYFVFYVTVKIIIMPTHLPLHVCSLYLA